MKANSRFICTAYSELGIFYFGTPRFWPPNNTAVGNWENPFFDTGCCTQMIFGSSCLNDGHCWSFPLETPRFCGVLEFVIGLYGNLFGLMLPAHWNGLGALFVSLQQSLSWLRLRPSWIYQWDIWVCGSSPSFLDSPVGPSLEFPYRADSSTSISNEAFLLYLFSENNLWCWGLHREFYQLAFRKVWCPGPRHHFFRCTDILNKFRGTYKMEYRHCIWWWVFFSLSFNSSQSQWLQVCRLFLA